MGSERLKVIQLDVTNNDDVTEARKQLDKYLDEQNGNKQLICITKQKFFILERFSVILWALINNAGMGTFGDLEWVPISTYKKIADVNVFGMIDVTKGFLPLIRKSKGNSVCASPVRTG